MLQNMPCCGLTFVNSLLRSTSGIWRGRRCTRTSWDPLEHDTELAYHRHLARRQAEMHAADSREEEAKKLPPERQAACEERKMQAMTARSDMILMGMENALYPNWKCKQDTKP